ncbi:ABC transporter permease [Paenibacillus sp. sgz500992]|uniref:ABC transporter permease n=1 Tax=Paenibacillus sp. sgz500992 TaxID=3242476 RepID=UPI0036D2473D
MLYCEWLKFRKSPLFWALPAVSLFGPLLFMVMRLGEPMSWEGYLSNEKLMYAFMTVTLWIALLASQIISKEYTDFTASVLYTYPRSRMSIIFTKLIIAFLILLASTFIEFIGMYITIWIFKGEPLPTELLNDQLARAGLFLLGQLAVLPLFALFSQISRSLLVPVLVAVAATITNLSLGLSGSKYFWYSPFSVVAAPYVSGIGNIETGKIIMLIVIVFPVSLAALLMHTFKMEVK